MKKRVVIVGGGFAGVKCARTLLKRARRELEVVVFSRDNHMVFQPLLPDVAGSSLNPRAVAPPLRQLLPKARCRTEEVLDLHPESSEITYECHDGSPRRMAYDHLVIACGNVVNLNLLPGMANHALPLKTIGDAIAMRAHVMQQLEKADLAETCAQRRFYLTYIVVGGGFSGVEVAGELNDLMLSSLKRYPNVRREDVMVTLLHSQPDLLPEVSPELRRFARKRMEARGIKVLTERKVAEVTKLGVLLGDGAKVEGATVICTVGTTANPLIGKLDAKKERGRLVTEPDLRLAGLSNVWAIGDCALVPNAFDGKHGPTTAQFAEREGRQCAENLVRVLRGEPTKPFHFKPLGAACGIGGRKGVAELFGFKFSGFLAWWLWRSAFLAKIPSLSQKLKVGIDWAWEVFFPRDLSHFRPAQTEPVSKAHYAPGEVLFKRGQALKDLYSIEHGEAEIVVQGPEGPFVAHVLGPGSLLAEATLADVMGEAEVRARTGLDVLVLGKQSLTRLSAALKPVEDLVERAVNRPKLGIWRHHPAAMRALSARTAAELPCGQEMIAADCESNLGQVFGAVIDKRAGCALITVDGKVGGIATRSDLLAALARGATRDTPIKSAMNAKPICIRASESAAMAAEKMVDGGLKFLPVVEDDGTPRAVLTSDDFVRFALSMAR
jgi:NADH dehydrogenase